MRPENTWQGIWEHSCTQNLSSSLIFLGLHLWMAPFNKHQRFSFGFKSRDPEALILCPWKDFDVCLGSLSCWKIHPWPSFSRLAEADRFWTIYCSSVESTMPLSFKSSWTASSKTVLKHQWPTTILNSEYQELFIACSPFFFFFFFTNQNVGSDYKKVLNTTFHL